MGASKKMLYEAVVLMTLVSLIYIGLSLFDRARNTASNLEESQMYTDRVTQEYGIMKYDGLEITGSAVITYIKSLVEVYNIPATITTANKTYTVSDTSLYSEFRKTSSQYYINPMSKYVVTVIRDANDAITSVKIVVK